MADKSIRKAQQHKRKIHLKFIELNKRKSLETSTIYIITYE